MSTTPQFTFTKAVKKALHARVALDGPSGSGKTWTALTTARALAGKDGRIAFLDTERRSGLLYADEFDFDHTPLDYFNPEHLIAWLAAAAEHGYTVAVIDSLSHFWEGIDGMLEQVDNVGRRAGSGGGFGGWKEMRPVERRMVDAMLAFPGHLIATMRTKTEWTMEEVPRRDGKGSTMQPRRVGTKAVQRDGIEYEFTVVGDMDLEHTMVISKSRCRALADQVIRKPGVEFGATLLAWLNSGESQENASTYRDRALAEGADSETLRSLWQEIVDAGLTNASVNDQMGATMTLGDLVKRLGQLALAHEEAAENAARQQQELADNEAARAAALAEQDALTGKSRADAQDGEAAA